MIDILELMRELLTGLLFCFNMLRQYIKDNIVKDTNQQITGDEILRERRKKIFSLRTLILLVLAITLILFLFSRIDLKQMTTALKQANVSLVLLSAFIYLLSNFFKSIRFSIMLHGNGISLSKMFAISSYQNFFNQIMPARTGELTFLYYTKTMANVRVSASLHTLLVSRMMDLVVVCIFFILSLIMYSDKSLPPVLMIAAVGLGAVSLLFVFKLSWFVMLGKKIFDLLVRILKIGEKSFVVSINEKVDVLLEDFTDIKMKKRMPLVALSSLFVWLCLYAFSYTTVLAFGVAIEPLAAVVGSTGAVLTNVLPINSFGSFGTMEAGWTGGFLFVGMSMQDAVTTGFGYHLINFFAAMVFAAACFGISFLYNVYHKRLKK